MLLVPGFLTFQLVLSTRKFAIRKPGETSGETPEASRFLTAGEQVFWTLALGTFEAGWLALLLAEWGQYSIGLVLLFLAAWSFVAGVWLWQRGYRQAWWREKF